MTDTMPDVRETRAVLVRAASIMGVAQRCQVCQVGDWMANRGTVRGTHGSRNRVVVVNVYEEGVWQRVEMFHPDCYAAAGRPHGDFTEAPPTIIPAKKPEPERQPEDEPERVEPQATDLRPRPSDDEPAPSSSGPEVGAPPQIEAPARAKEEPMPTTEPEKLRGWVIEHRMHILASEDIDEDHIRRRVREDPDVGGGTLVVVEDSLEVSPARIDFRTNGHATEERPDVAPKKKRGRPPKRKSTGGGLKPLECRKGCGRTFGRPQARGRHEAYCKGGK